VAQFFLVVEFHTGAQRTLHHHRGAFYAWNGTAYLEISEDEIRARLYPFLDQCKNAAGKGEKVKPNTALVSRVYDALKARAELEGRISAPSWLDEDHALPPHEVIACANGLLHLPSLKLLPHTPPFTHTTRLTSRSTQTRQRQFIGWSSYVSFGPMTRSPSQHCKNYSATA
jgi:putative DNA primase/helicase